jgi:hypothetical protein
MLAEEWRNYPVEAGCDAGATGLSLKLKVIEKPTLKLYIQL